MRKRQWAITTATAIAGAIITSTSSAAAPLATTAPPPPRAGAYAGHTSQGLRFSLRVSAMRTALSAGSFGFRLHCADHRTLLFSVSPILTGHAWKLNASGGTGFTHSFRDTTAERYWMRGRFGARGTVTGTLSTSWRSPRDGLCRSGRITWRATLRR